MRIFQTLLLLFALSFYGSGSAAPKKTTYTPIQYFQAGQQALSGRQYAVAQKYFLAAAAKLKNNSSAQYYLALASAYAGDFGMARRAAARVIAMSTPGDRYEAEAQKLVKEYSRQIGNVQPYTCRKDGQLMRWAKAKMPVKIFITQGLMLPVNYRAKQGAMDSQTGAQLCKWLTQKEFYNRLERDPTYQAQYYSLVATGLAEWNWLNTEKIVPYVMVNDPTMADIVVFYCPTFGSNLAGLTSYLSPGQKLSRVIIEIETDKRGTSGRFRDMAVMSVAAHEFGHAFGLHAHSPNPDDVMGDHHKTSVIDHSGHIEDPPTRVSENDKETMRALYDLDAEVYQ